MIRRTLIKRLQDENWALAFENQDLRSQRDALIAANQELQRALFELLEMADEDPAGDDHADTHVH